MDVVFHRTVSNFLWFCSMLSHSKLYIKTAHSALVLQLRGHPRAFLMSPGTSSPQGHPAQHLKLWLCWQALNFKCSAELGTKSLLICTVWILIDSYPFLSIKNYVICCLISQARRTSLALTFLSTRSRLTWCFYFLPSKSGCSDPVRGKPHQLPCTGCLQFTIPQTLLKHSSWHLIFLWS